MAKVDLGKVGKGVQIVGVSAPADMGTAGSLNIQNLTTIKESFGSIATLSDIDNLTSVDYLGTIVNMGTIGTLAHIGTISDIDTITSVDDVGTFVSIGTITALSNLVAVDSIVADTATFTGAGDTFQIDATTISNVATLYIKAGGRTAYFVETGGS